MPPVTPQPHGAVWALLPVKAPAQAKTRLASVLEPAESARLCSAMLEDMLAALAAARHVAGVALLTADATIAARARELGHTVLTDTRDELNAALDEAARELRSRGADTLLVLPGDLPTLEAADIDALLERHAGGISVSPAIRDGGTNGLVCTPPDAIPFCFGADSARRHLQAAAERGLPAHRLPLNAYFRDIDLPEDLCWLLNREAGNPCGASRTLGFLHDSGIGARLGQAVWGVAS